MPEEAQKFRPGVLRMKRTLARLPLINTSLRKDEPIYREASRLAADPMGTFPRTHEPKMKLATIRKGLDCLRCERS